MISNRVPRLKDMVDLYAAVLDGVGPRPVVFRTLDLGGDKDSYPKKRNSAVLHGFVNSIFADLPGYVKDALKNDAWKALVEPMAK